MNDATRTSEWLMMQVKAGSSEHFEQLIRSSGPAIMSLLSRSLTDRHRAEELFQEVFLAVWSKRKSYKHPRPFRPWLYKIAVNRLRQEFRKLTPKREFADAEIPKSVLANEKTPLNKLIGTEFISQALAATRELPNQQRTVLMLRIWNELSYSEIASVLNCTETTVRSNMHHGLAALRKKLSVCQADT